MIGVGCLCVIVAVATHTGCRWIGIVALMAFVTGQGCMRALNRVKIVVTTKLSFMILVIKGYRDFIMFSMWV